MASIVYIVGPDGNLRPKVSGSQTNGNTREKQPEKGSVGQANTAVSSPPLIPPSPITQPTTGSVTVQNQVADFLRQHAQEVLRSIDDYIPVNGFKVATSSSLSEALEIIELWNRYKDKWESSEVEKSANPELLLEEFYGELSRKIGIVEPYSPQSFDELISRKLIDHLAKLGVVLALPIRAISDRPDPNQTCYMYYYPHNFIWKITNIQRNRQVKLLDGSTKSFLTATVEPSQAQEEGYSTCGFARHGALFLHAREIEKAIANEEKRKQTLPKDTLFLAESKDVIDFLEKREQAGLLNNDIDYLVYGIIFSLYKSLSMGPTKHYDRLKEKEAEIASHEAQHDEDHNNLDFREIYLRMSAHDEDATVFAEFRPRINEFQTSPRTRLCDMLKYLQFTSITNPGKDNFQKSKTRVVLLSEYTVFQAIVEEVSKNPGAFGIEIKQHPTISPRVQICGQLYKLAEQRNSSQLQIILNGVSPLLRNPGDFTAWRYRLEQSDPFFTHRIKPLLPQVSRKK